MSTQQQHAFFVSYVGGVLLAGFVVASALGQTSPPPTNEPPSAPVNNVVPPPVPPVYVPPQVPPSLPPMPNPQPRPANYAPAYSPGYEPTGYPSAAVQTVAVARTRLALARAEFDRARNDFYVLIGRMHDQFERSAELVAAKADEQRAYDAYIAARQRALNPLNNDPSYRAINDLRGDLARRIIDLRGAEKPSQGELHSLAAAKLDYAARARQMEAEQLNSDPLILDARARLTTASARVATLRSEFKVSLMQRPEILAAQRTIEDARITHIGAEAYYSGALRAQEIALHYAYMLHRYDQNRYIVHSNPYDYPYGYGYGYGSNYP